MQQQLRASCKYLTHKHASYFGCTLQEVLVISLIFITADVFLAILLSFFIGSVFLSFVILFICSYFLIRLTAQYVGSFKVGKQQGYFGLLFKRKMHKKFGFSIPFIMREGKWLARRSL